MSDSLINDLLIELECPVCSAYLTPPIRQCATGHSICESCRNKLTRCGLCESNFTESRNISLEGLAVKMRYPCINKSTGCTAVLAYNEREVHELQCKYKGFNCAMENCTWIGKLEDLPTHWASKKMTSKPYRNSNVCHTKMKNESYYVNMVDAYNQLFWFKCKLTKKKLYWAVQLIGKKDQANNYFYEIEIFRQKYSKRKILFSDYCQPIDVENPELLKEANCVSMAVDMIKEFVNDEQLLIYYMRVHEVVAKKSQHRKEDSKVQIVKNKKYRDRSKGPQNPSQFKEFKTSPSSDKEKKPNEELVIL